MSLGEDQGGLPPRKVVQGEGDILADCERLLALWHDPQPYAMNQVALAPCSPFSVTPALLRESAILANRHNVGLHTHLAETEEDAMGVMDQLEQNRKVIDRNVQRNKKINSDLNQADKLVDKMKKWWKNL